MIMNSFLDDAGIGNWQLHMAQWPIRPEPIARWRGESSSSSSSVLFHGVGLFDLFWFSGLQCSQHRRYIYAFIYMHVNASFISSISCLIFIWQRRHPSSPPPPACRWRGPRPPRPVAAGGGGSGSGCSGQGPPGSGRPEARGRRQLPVGPAGGWGEPPAAAKPSAPGRRRRPSCSYS